MEDLEVMIGAGVGGLTGTLVGAAGVGVAASGGGIVVGSCLFTAGAVVIGGDVDVGAG